MLYHPISFAEYRKLPAISNSSLKHFGRTAAHAKYEIGRIITPTESMLIGSLTDHLLFGTEFAFVVSPYEDFRKTEAKDWRDQQQAAGIVVFKSHVVNDVIRMVESIKRHPQAAELLAKGRSQVGLTWELNVEGAKIPAKGLIDWVSDEIAALTDLKTTDDASYDKFQRHIIAMGYDVQAALYTDLWRLNTGEELAWTWIVTETDPPHATVVYIASPELLAHGRARYEVLLGKYAKALSTGVWAGYPDTAVLMTPPAWVK